MTVADLKKIFIDSEIHSFSWLPTKDMWADMMTKEMKIPHALEDIIQKNVMKIP